MNKEQDDLFEKIKGQQRELGYRKALMDATDIIMGMAKSELDKDNFAGSNSILDLGVVLNKMDPKKGVLDV